MDLIYSMLWSFLTLFRFLDNIKLDCSRIIGSIWNLDRIQNLVESGKTNPFVWWIYRGMIQTTLHLFILVHGLIISPAKAFLGSCKEKMICWPSFRLDFMPLCGGSLYISLIAGTACMVGSCLNWEIDFNELQFLLLSWNWSSHRLN